MRWALNFFLRQFCFKNLIGDATNQPFLSSFFFFSLFFFKSSHLFSYTIHLYSFSYFLFIKTS
ncbi:hypothetical protein K501DRAFT_11720 [Backusella circina FSU 941]|nr:hypothetical protein K501DRAFT_11720 [Backusella circina FSU 941]